MTLEQLRKYKDKIIAIVQARHGFNVRVFGSVARGDSTPDSDVDFLISLKPEASLFDLGGMYMDLRDLLGTEVDLLDEKSAQNAKYMKDIIFGEAIAL